MKRATSLEPTQSIPEPPIRLILIDIAKAIPKIVASSRPNRASSAHGAHHPADMSAVAIRIVHTDRCGRRSKYPLRFK
jgi:hypothetical protein